MFAADAGFLAWAGVMLASALRFDHGARLHIHMLADGVDPGAVAPLAAMATGAGALFSVHDVGHRCAARAAGLPLGAHLSRATYARFFLGDLLPAEVARVIYLDVDVLCRAPLRNLWSFDLGGAVAGVALDCATRGDAVGYLAHLARAAQSRNARRLGLPEDGRYFNAGVMLIDLGLWREERVGERALAWTAAQGDRVDQADQDGLNVILRGRVAWLDDGWNVLSQWTWQEPCERVKILHFAGPDKPWHADYTGYGNAAWQAAKAASPFRDAPLVMLGPSGTPGGTARVAANDGVRCLRVRGVSGQVEGDIVGNVGIAHRIAGRSGVCVYRREATLPPGAYTIMFVMGLIADASGEPAAGERKRVRFEITASDRSLATLELDVAPGTALRHMPVTLGFVLPGPARILGCWLSTWAGARAELLMDITLTRQPDAWVAALAG